MSDNDKKIEDTIESLIKKGYLKRNDKGEIGITLKGQRAGLELSGLLDYN